tara:strand:- start:16 stop:429 length:414 start_codon:yes stop_codon:yes gene_type:complete
MNLTGQGLISLVAIMIMIGPMVADFNRTHATNPLWTPHARFHVVWQVFTNSTLAVLTLYFIWAMGNLLLGALMNYIWIATFFATLAVMPMFEGALADENGIKPIVWRFGDKVVKVDTNLFGACMMTVFNTTGLVLAL